MIEGMPDRVVENYLDYLKLKHQHQVYVSGVGKWNVWDFDLKARICIEPEWFEKDMEQYARKDRTA